MLKSFFLLFALGFCANTYADNPARTWEFDLKTPGTYKVQVEHNVNYDARGTNVSYSITIGTETRTRDFDLIANRPFIPLIADVSAPQRMRIVIAGPDQSVLNHTQVYAYDADTLPVGEFFHPAKSNDFHEIRKVRGLLTTSAGKIDLAKAKLTIDRLIDPTIDVATNLKALDMMVSVIRKMPEFGDTSMSKLVALKRYVYERGEWNGNRPFEYDFDDPFGANIRNKLLSNYLVSRKGNCVTMPFLVIILGQRLGIDVTASTAPKHLLVKWKNEGGTWINLEATSGANPARDVWIRGQMPMTDEALANGVYLRPLTKKETVALMVTTLGEFYVQQHEYEKAIAVSQLILEYAPRDVGTMTLMAVAYGRLGRQRFMDKYPSPNQIPQNERGHFEYLSRNHRLWFAKAEALGWREESKEAAQEYMKDIRKARQQRISN